MDIHRKRDNSKINGSAYKFKGDIDRKRYIGRNAVFHE